MVLEVRTKHLRFGTDLQYHPQPVNHGAIKHIWSASASTFSPATLSASCRCSSCMSVTSSWNLGIVAPSQVAAGGASDRLCIAVVVPFPGIRSVAISDSRTMAALSGPTVKPDGCPAYTNISDAIDTNQSHLLYLEPRKRSRSVAPGVSVFRQASRLDLAGRACGSRAESHIHVLNQQSHQPNSSTRKETSTS